MDLLVFRLILREYFMICGEIVEAGNVDDNEKTNERNKKHRRIPSCAEKRFNCFEQWPNNEEMNLLNAG